MRVRVGRLDNNKVVEVGDDASINTALSAGGYTKAENEVIQDLNGEEYDGNSQVSEHNVDGFYLVQRVKSGHY